MKKKRNILLIAALLSFTLGACHFGGSSSTINSSSDSSNQQSSIVSSIESSSSSSSSSLERKQLNPDEVLEYVDDPEYIGGLAVKAVNRDINGDLIIPSEHDGKPVTSIYRFGFDNCDYLYSVVIPDSVLLIEWDAFNG